VTFINRCQVTIGQVPDTPVSRLPALFRELLDAAPESTTPAEGLILEAVLTRVIVRLCATLHAAGPPGELAGSSILTLLSSNDRQPPAARFGEVLVFLDQYVNTAWWSETPARQFGTSAQQAGPATEPRVRRTVEIIDRICSNSELGLAEVAARAHLSPAYLSRLLKKHTGLGFLEHLRTIRLMKAAHLLTATSLIVKEIATEVGYKHVSDFDRHFKHRFGVTPGEWRRKTG
jgi:AraC-like DNA-binding protein